jgi:hypothetical protein
MFNGVPFGFFCFPFLNDQFELFAPTSLLYASVGWRDLVITGKAASEHTGAGEAVVGDTSANRETVKANPTIAFEKNFMADFC